MVASITHAKCSTRKLRRLRRSRWLAQAEAQISVDQMSTLISLLSLLSRSSTDGRERWPYYAIILKLALFSEECKTISIHQEPYAVHDVAESIE